MAIENKAIQAAVAKVFNDALDVYVPSPTTDLLESGILDSQKFVELLLHLEQTFDVKVDLEDFEIDNFRSIETIASLLARRKLAEMGPANSKDFPVEKT